MTKLQITFCVVCCLLATGCDPVRTTGQLVRLQVVDSTSQQPVEDAKVSLKFDCLTGAARQPKHQEEVMPPEEWDDHNLRIALEGYVWQVGRTDSQGQVDIDLMYTGIDKTRGPEPPPSRDDVTGLPYLIMVRGGQLPEEELSVVMKPGASVKGKAYNLFSAHLDGNYFELPRRVQWCGSIEWVLSFCKVG